MKDILATLMKISCYATGPRLELENLLRNSQTKNFSDSGYES